ncbi:cupin domain-containing protein [Streptomyces sp. NPDC006197]|uniref:cupin domain-containing protein n=1 Tax=Streptomyces sp. NPDC006197 TaxID=3156685 RepID=UPI0033B8A2DB
MTGRIDDAEFVPLAPEEGGWEPVEGDANARIHTLCENDHVWSGVALFDPCTFNYHADHASVIHLLEGAATITSDGHTSKVGAGDVVYLTPGITSTWVVKAPVREFFAAFTPVAGTN